MASSNPNGFRATLKKELKMMLNQFTNKGFVDLPKILAVLPISKSSWWQGVKDGRYPKSIKHGGRTFWRVADIQALIKSIENEAE